MENWLACSFQNLRAFNNNNKKDNLFASRYDFCENAKKKRQKNGLLRCLDLSRVAKRVLAKAGFDLETKRPVGPETWWWEGDSSGEKKHCHFQFKSLAFKCSRVYNLAFRSSWSLSCLLWAPVVVDWIGSEVAVLDAGSTERRCVCCYVSASKEKDDHIDGQERWS